MVGCEFVNIPDYPVKSMMTVFKKAGFIMMRSPTV